MPDEKNSKKEMEKSDTNLGDDSNEKKAEGKGLDEFDENAMRIGRGQGSVLMVSEDLPVLALRNTVLFPGSIVPLGIGRPKTLKLVEDAIKNEYLIAVIAQRDAEIDDPAPEHLYSLGCVARIVKHVRSGVDNMSVVVQGLTRIKVLEYTQSLPYLKAKVTGVEEDNPNPLETEALTVSLKKTAKEVLQLIPELPPSASELLDRVEDPGVLSDLIASNIDGPADEKQGILESLHLPTRMHKVLELLSRQLEILKLSDKISNQVKGEMSRTQREYYLRQQLKAIKDELGESDDSDDDLAELEARVDEKELPEEAEKAVRKELRRLRNMNPSQAEYTVARTYVEWLCDLPWHEKSEDRIDLDEVQKILDDDHYGLEKVKKRIVEYLAVRKLKEDMRGPILCFVGPPGVGKTSLGQSIARSMGREFIRASMGGVRDEAEIRGHRRTYVGALPGRIIQGMKKAGKINPVFVLDEIDKLAHDFRGDPAAALLEVLDPEQNFGFADHYLNTPYDLSNTFFIATANLLEPIPPALKDRMEVLELPGYTLDEKMHIARRHLIPKQLDGHGLTEGHIEFLDEAIEKVISSYTREAGVRNLERELASVCRWVAVRVASGNKEKQTIKLDMLSDILGPEKHFNEMADRTEIPGVATGLAWTAAGGDILFIEATRMRGKGKLSLTGQLGDVMKESAQAALSYVRSQASHLGISEDLFENVDIHLHIPAGAIPKDGPSAGVTMLTSLVSLLTNICVRADVAMTGELTLRGSVLPVGGIKEKVLAAKRAGVNRIILPERNRKDLVEIPKENIEDIDFVFAQRMEDVLAAALRDMPKPLNAKIANGVGGNKASSDESVTREASP
jgi:ATP-dependent Lon protease